MVDVEQGQRRPSTPFLRLLGPPPTPKTPPSDSRDPQTSPFERPQTPPARREPLNQAILTSLQRSRTQKKRASAEAPRNPDPSRASTTLESVYILRLSAAQQGRVSGWG